MSTSDPDKLAYESIDPARPATASPTESDLENQAAPRAHDPYAALRYRDYVIFSVGWMVSVVGNQMTAAALGWEIFDRTQRAVNLGWLGGIQALPLLVLALPAGVLADHFDRRRIMAITSVLAAITSIGFAAMSYSLSPHYLWIMFGLLLLNSTFLVLGRPARSAFLPTVVPPTIFTNAVTWNASFYQTATVLGPALAGLVIATSLRHFHNVRLAYIIDALCMLAFAITMSSLPTPQYGNSKRSDKDAGAIERLTAGIRFVWRTKIILATLTLDLFAVLLGGAVYLTPIFAKDILHVGSVGFGWLRAADALGALLMALIVAHTPPMKRAGRAMLLAVGAFGAATIIFGFSRNFYLSFAAIFLVGAFDNISVVVRHTLVQVLTPDDMRGRVSAVNNIFIGASNELGGLESGLTAAWLGPVKSVVLGGIGTLLTVSLVAVLAPHLRKFGRLDTAKHE
jgi:MFS family permease